MSNLRSDLIYDLGMHRGEDVSYYLRRGFRVIGVDANPRMVAYVERRFRRQVASNRLIALNFAVSDSDFQEVDFYLSSNSDLSSLKKSLTERGPGRCTGSVKVKTRTLTSLVREYGCPYYLKIDLEGNERVCLQSLSRRRPLPRFISVEAECFSPDEEVTDEQSLGTLQLLHLLGYRRFKLVDQSTLKVLEQNRKYYLNTAGQFSHLRRFWVRISRGKLRRFLFARFGFGFPLGSSGTFGHDLNSEWLDYETAMRTYLFHRKDYMKATPVNLGFWCDWHAGLSDSTT